MSLPIQASHLQLRYDEDSTALEDVSFTLEPNKIYGLIGRNGSGKSSLLSLLAAFRKPTGGEVRIDGQPVFENAELMSQISLIRETGDTVEDDKVDVAFRYAEYLRPGWDKEYAHELAEKFRLPMKRKVDQLSRGQRSALGVILGLASRTPITIFDESYLGMDAPSRYLFYDELISDFGERPHTVILSTHLIEEVSALFEEVLILDRGRLLLHEATDALLERGVSVTGAAPAVDEFTRDMHVIGAKDLGRIRSAMVYGTLTDEQRERATREQLDLTPIALQDLFVHLTTPNGQNGGEA